MTTSLMIFLRMRNVSNKCRKTQNTHFMFSDFFFSEVVPLWECRKIWWSQTGRRQHGACAWRTEQVSLHARACAPTPTPLHIQTHAHNTHTHTHCFPRQQWFRERASMLWYSTLPVLLITCQYLWFSVSIYVQQYYRFRCNVLKPSGSYIYRLS
jgi:hypothetical protein